MKGNIGHLSTIAFTDRKETVSGFIIEYSKDWILLRYNTFDYIIDGYIIIKNKNIKSLKRSESEEFTEKVIRLKNLKLDLEDKIPLTSLSSILEHLTDTYGVFQIQTKRESASYLGKLVEIDNKELVIHFLQAKGTWGGDMSFKPKKIRFIEFETDYINSLKLVAE